ncbi:MAG TPA: hypothetical protein VJ208_02660 [Candidatus Nanoarchaeia archaeon]|nr:hypothetical protein [Candidatus Nanoarchaeia archaeon]
MHNNCNWIESILATAILVFTFWPTAIVSAMISKWIIVVSAALLLLHALFCKKCEGLCTGMMKSGRKRR